MPRLHAAPVVTLLLAAVAAPARAEKVDVVMLRNGTRVIGELGFDLRSSLMGGWAYTLARDRRNQLVGGAGLSVNREKPVEGESTTNLEAVLGFDFANFAYDFPNTDIQVSALGYLGLNQWGRFRLEANASLRRELFSDFYFGLKGYESYDSDPATEGALKNDWGLSFTLGYSF